MSNGCYWPYPLPDGSDLLQRLTQAEQSVRQLNDRIRQMERTLEEVRSRTPLHIEYHFDQLKVNELRGTLNVGLSPQGVQGIDSFEASPGAWQPIPAAMPPASPEPIGALQQQMYDYMNLEAPSMLMGMEQQYGVPLDDEQRGIVLQDVRKQLGERVHYYAKTAPYPAEGPDEERKKWSRNIIEKTTRDVNAAFQAFLSGLKGASPQGGGNTP